MSRPITLDDVLHPGQKVKITRTVTITYEIDIREHLDMTGDMEISVEDLQEYEQDNTSVSDIMDDYDASADIVSDYAEVTEIK